MIWSISCGRKKLTLAGSKLGDLLTPRVGSLPNGLEPQITPVSASAAAARQNVAPVAGVKALTNQGNAAPAVPAGASTVAPSGGSNPMDAIKGLKGLFGR